MTEMETLDAIREDEFFLRSILQRQNKDYSPLYWTVKTLRRLYRLSGRTYHSNGSTSDIELRQPSFIISLAEDALMDQ